MSRYFEGNSHPDETVINGVLNYELVAHSLIVFMSDEENGTDLMKKCYRELEKIMHSHAAR